MNSAKELIEEIELRAVVPFDYLEKVLNSHSSRLDTALALLELVESHKLEVGNERYIIESPFKTDYWEVIRPAMSMPAHRGSLSDCINFIHQQVEEK